MTLNGVTVLISLNRSVNSNSIAFGAYVKVFEDTPIHSAAEM